MKIYGVFEWHRNKKQRRREREVQTENTTTKRNTGKERESTQELKVAKSRIISAG